jgi:hypothetical protein
VIAVKGGAITGAIAGDHPVVPWAVPGDTAFGFSIT